MDEVHASVGVIGFCFGGTQVFRLAKALNPTCVVSYYGSGVADMLDGLDSLTCPIRFHFGDADPYIPNDQVAAIRAAQRR
jgi:carboxymethylenebutenolidase